MTVFLLLLITHSPAALIGTPVTDLYLNKTPFTESHVKTFAMFCSLWAVCSVKERKEKKRNMRNYMSGSLGVSVTLWCSFNCHILNLVPHHTFLKKPSPCIPQAVGIDAPYVWQVPAALLAV